MSTKPELISFDICPYVQRSVITLLEKKQAFELTYIDLANKPDWFLALSPLGKVPVLRVGNTVLFESAVINEYLDEVTPPSMHPQNPLQKAQNRAWIEVSSQLIMSLFHFLLAQSQEKYEYAFGKMLSQLQRVEEQLAEGPFFNGADFMLVDAAFAPFFMRLAFLSELLGIEILADFPKCVKWHVALMDKGSVQKSVIPDIKEKFLAYIQLKEGVLAGKLSV
jgi:glutathione S-transferase